MTDIRVEVVFALADRQQLLAVSLPVGATVDDAITESTLSRRFPMQNLDALQAGVWGHLVTRDHVLSDGDRVEIYRPLQLDPREARRQRALVRPTIGNAAKG